MFVALVGTGWPPALAILVVLVALVLVGILQGAVVAAGLNPIITTLAAGAIIFGIVADATNGRIVRVGDHPVSWGNATIAGIPLEVLVFGLFTAGGGRPHGAHRVRPRDDAGRRQQNAAEVSGVSFASVTLVRS